MHKARERASHQRPSSELGSEIVPKGSCPRPAPLAKCRPLSEELIIEPFRVRYPPALKGRQNPFVPGPDAVGFRALVKMLGNPPTVEALGRLIQEDPDWRMRVFEASGRYGTIALYKIQNLAEACGMIGKEGWMRRKDIRRLRALWLEKAHPEDGSVPDGKGTRR